MRLVTLRSGPNSTLLGPEQETQEKRLDQTPNATWWTTRNARRTHTKAKKKPTLHTKGEKKKCDRTPNAHGGTTHTTQGGPTQLHATGRAKNRKTPHYWEN